MICIFLCVQFSIKADETDSLFRVAQKQVEAKNYRDAAITYERIVYKNTDKYINALALLKKAMCYKADKKYVQSLAELHRVHFHKLDDSLEFRIRYEVALCAYLSDNFNEAVLQIEQMNHYLKDSHYLPQSYFLQVLAYNQTEKWKKAKDAVLLFIDNQLIEPDKKTRLKDRFEAMYDEGNLPNIKKPATARKLSTFLPGAGQIYAGYIGEGVMNFLLHILCLGTGAYGFYTGYYLTGYFVGLGLFQKFYFGGVKRAVFLTKKNNFEKRQEFNEKVKKILSGIE